MRFAIGETLRKNAGLVMHPHLFRHAIAKIVVERNPDMYVPVSRHLGHKRLDMTMAHYLGTETRAAARHIDRLLRDAREPGGKTS
jgi:integrase